MKTLRNIQRIQKYESKTNWFILFSSKIKAADLYNKNIMINGKVYTLLPPQDVYITFKVQWLPVEVESILTMVIQSLCINATTGKLSKIKEIKCEDGIGTGVFNITIQYNPDKLNQISLPNISGRKFFNKSPVFIIVYGDPIRCQFCSGFNHLKKDCEKYKSICTTCKHRGHNHQQCNMAAKLDTESQMLGINNDLEVLEQHDLSNSQSRVNNESAKISIIVGKSITATEETNNVIADVNSKATSTAQENNNEKEFKKIEKKKGKKQETKPVTEATSATTNETNNTTSNTTRSHTN